MSLVVRPVDFPVDPVICNAICWLDLMGEIATCWIKHASFSWGNVLRYKLCNKTANIVGISTKTLACCIFIYNYIHYLPWCYVNFADLLGPGLSDIQLLAAVVIVQSHCSLQASDGCKWLTGDSRVHVNAPDFSPHGKYQVLFNICGKEAQPASFA